MAAYELVLQPSAAADQDDLEMSQDDTPVGVAGAGAAQKTLAALNQGGQLPRPIRPVSVDGDGRVDKAEAAGVTVLWRPGFASPQWLLAAVDNLPDLAWVHSDAVGVDSLPVAELAERGLVLTNGAGSFSRPMAEWVMLAILSAAKRFPRFVRLSDRGVWDPSPLLNELDGAVILLLGLGSVNGLVAPMAAAFGMEVRAVSRQARADLPAGVTRMVAPDHWRAALPDADYVVLGLPLTSATANTIDADALAAMKPTAWLVNVARGALVDEAALVRALDADQIGGAVLDTFVEEPLPEDHPLWRRENVTVVPHFTWSSPRALDRIQELFTTQLARWLSGTPLANVVDAAAGY
jgi:phosphoglycerate dehydrogenase-like enzyme